MSGEDPTLLSVVIPTLNEGEHLPALLADLKGLTLPAQVVVVDAGSTDGTTAAAEAAGARVLTSAAPGRGRQLRHGAEQARGRWLLFLHADSRISPAAIGSLEAFLRSSRREDGEVFAHFGLRFHAVGWSWRLFELGQRLRERGLGLVYGDQGLLVRASTYARAGGYPDWPIMEDVAMVDRLRRIARRVRLPDALLTSPRRYQDQGPWRRTLRNLLLITRFRLGVPPEHLASHYRPQGSIEDRCPRRTLLLFTKAPRAGYVKTRLSAGVGEERALEIYRDLGRSVMDAVRSGPYRCAVFYAPPGAESEVAGWLSRDDLEFHPQVPGDLGVRMSAALGWALEQADEACLVGLDAPELTEALVMEAFSSLAQADVAVGPATDGGYYLVATRRPCPELFADIPWGTDRVLAKTLRRARDLGLRVHLLRELRDVDRIEDL